MILRLKLACLMLTIAATVNAQTGTFKYQYENDQAKGGHFSFSCPNDSSLNFETDASAGYLGAANNPYQQATVGKGPIPNGTWTISSVKNETLAILRLTPGTDVNINFRDGFLIHGQGENETPDQSSHGCIILQKQFRIKLQKAFKAYGPMKIIVTNFTTSDPGTRS